MVKWLLYKVRQRIEKKIFIIISFEITIDYQFIIFDF